MKKDTKKYCLHTTITSDTSTQKIQCGDCGEELVRSTLDYKPCPNGYPGENMVCCRCVKPIQPYEGKGIEKLVKEHLEKYFDTRHPCKKCKGFVPDGAIICCHCNEHDP